MENRILRLPKIACAAGIVLLMAGGGGGGFDYQ